MKRQTIEPGDIRKGDLIRWEDTSNDPTPGRVLVVEYRASHDEHSQFRDGQHYLLDRPTPPVVLPTEPTLGWASGTYKSGRPVVSIFGSWKLGDDHTLLNRTDHTHRDSEGSVHLPSGRVTAFTPATAVPTEAIEALRTAELQAEVTIGDNEAYVLRAKAMRAFLAAVDRANGESA